MKNSLGFFLTCNYLYQQAKGEQVGEAKVVGDDLRHWKGKIFGPVSKDKVLYCLMGY